MRILLLLPLILCGCMSPTAKILKQLKDDPATVDIRVSTIYGVIDFHRSYPTNYVAKPKP